MQKRIVVLGGVGFIGTHLCLRLLEEGHEVFCVDIRDAVNSPLLRGVLQHPLFRYVHHNIINGFSIRCDEIYNLASPSRVRYNKALPVETLRVSVLGAINALDTARTEHARVVVTRESALAPQHFAPAEKHERRHRHDVVAVHCVQHSAVVDIHLVYIHAAVHLPLELVDGGVHHLAWPAPCGEKVHERQRVPPDDLVKIRCCHSVFPF